MDFSLYFPIWDKLTPDEQRYLSQNILFRKVTKGTVIHDGNISCTGLLLVGSGQLRSYMLSEDGRELTLYRLFEHDMCLFSAACMMTSLQFEVIIEAEKDTELWIILPNAYKKLMESSATVANYTCELMATRFSDNNVTYDYGMKVGETCKKMYDHLQGIQYGRVEDIHNWNVVVE